MKFHLFQGRTGPKSSYALYLLFVFLLIVVASVTILRMFGGITYYLRTGP